MIPREIQKILGITRIDPAAYGFIKFMEAIYLAGGLRAKLEVEGVENLQSLKDKGFVLLPNHQHYADILVESKLLYDNLGRYAFYPASDVLPTFYETAGAISVPTRKRLKERLANAKSADEKREIVFKASLRGERFCRALPYLMKYDEIIVFHPEAGLNDFGTNSKVDTSRLKKLLDAQESCLEMHKKGTSFVPLQIEYFPGRVENVLPSKPGLLKPIKEYGENSRAYIEQLKSAGQYGNWRTVIKAKIGSPLQTTSLDELADHLASQNKFFYR